jgi:outer membrane receptor protein involved in Fe transport
MTATTRRRPAVFDRPRAACLCGSVLVAAALLWLPVHRAGADAESPAAEAVQPVAAETGDVDSSTVVADSLEAGAIDSFAVQAGAVDSDTLAAATRGVGFRPSFPARGLRLDGSTGILRDVDLRRWRMTFFQVAEPRAKPEREGRE